MEFNNCEYTELVNFQIINPDYVSGEVETVLSDEELALKELLNSWGFGHLFALLKSEEITQERLLHITEEDLKELLKNFKLGVRIDFRRKLTEWKIQNNVTTWSTCDTLSDVRSQVPSENTSSSPAPLCNSFAYSNSFNLLEVVKGCANGNYVFRIFEKTKKLDDASRKIIIDSIIAWHMQHSVRITRPMFEVLASDIQRHFNDNKTIYYKKSGNIPSGRLYDKYQNHTKRLRKLGILSSTVGSPRSSTPLSNTAIEENSSDDEEHDVNENHKLWLQLNNSPWSDVENKWKSTFKLRRKGIIDKNNSTSNVLEQWPLYKHSDGFALVDMDFGVLHTEKSFNLLKNWASFKTKIIPILNDKVKDKQNVNLLKSINTVNSEDVSCNLIVGLLIHSLLPPTVKHTVKKENKRQIVKSTIKDSQDSFFMHVNVINDFERKLDAYRNTLISRNQTLQPIIIGVGIDLLTITEFIVFYDNIKYKFSNFLAAFDCCFKIFHVLDLQYPRDSYSFWIFVQKYFFIINSNDDNVTPSVLCLIQDLN